MRTIALIVLTLATATAAEPLTDWTYRIDAAPLSEQYVDPGGTLTDGVTGRGKTAIWRGNDIPVQIDLGGAATVEGVRIHQHRHNLNYKLKQLTVKVMRAGQWQEVASREGFDGPTEAMDFVHDIAFEPVTTDALLLDFAGVGVLSLSEIEILGSRGQAVAAGGAFANVPFADGAAPTATEIDLDGDGQVELVLENRFVRLIAAPAMGGVVRSLRVKPDGPELVNAENAGYGLLRDQFWQPNYSFGDRFYFHRLDNQADRASIELWATGVGGMMSFTEIKKTLTLTADGPVIGVHYDLTNQPSSQTDYEYGYWSHNWTGVTGATNTYFNPTVNGVEAFRLDAETARESHDIWYREPARGWTAVATDAGDGLAMVVPYKYLNLFYHWNGAGRVAATHEYRFNLLTVKAGETLSWDVKLIPWSDDLPAKGLRRVTGVVDGVVGAIEPTVAGGKLTVDATLFQPPGAGAAHELNWRVVKLPERETVTEAPEPLKLAPGGRLEVGQEWELAPGGYALQLEVARDGKPQGTIEAPVAVGATRVAYRLEPESEQVGRKQEATVKPAYEIRTDVVTPHIPWARPLPGGKIKALVLMDDQNSREAVELAERIDLDLDYTKFRTTFDKELLYQGDLSVLTLDAAQKRLGDKLKANRYDVIVLSGFNWNFHFSDANRQQILDQVRAGTGLILVQPDGFTAEQAAELPIAGVAKEGTAARHMSAFYPWSSAADHRLTAGFDWSRFPVTRRHVYDTPPSGEVIATIGDDAAPLIILGQLGDGRVASCTWDVLTHAMSYRGYSGLTPLLSYRGAWLRPEFADLPPGYQEPWFALLSRLVGWAAQRESGVRVAAVPTVEAQAGEEAVLSVDLAADAPVAGAKLEVWWTADVPNDVYEIPPRSDTPVELTAGRQTVTLPVLMEALNVGDNLAQVVVRDSAGASLAWGFGTVTVAAPVQIAEMAVAPETLLPEGGVWQEDSAVETPVFQAAEPITVTATLSAPAAANQRAEILLRSATGRELLRQPVDLAAGATELRASVMPPPLVEQGIFVELQVGEQRQVRRVVAMRPRVWDRFWFTSWNGQWLWRTHYLFDFNSAYIRDWGLDVALHGQVELDTGKVRDNAFFGINHSWLGLLLSLGKDVPDFGDRAFSDKAAAYAKSKEKQYLEREPSLVDPVWRQQVAGTVSARVEQTLPSGGTYDYCMGDEMSLTHYTRFHDFDWSPQSLADFRRWLQGRYADLGALNQSWSTNFGAWDDVVPLTREEAQAAENPAAWAEFRLYMNHQLADFYRFVDGTIKAIDPHAHAGLSGTQSPEAGNGMDWWLLSDAFGYYHSYNTSWSNEMRRSFQKLGGGADQSPYYAGYSSVDPATENRMWWCLLHDTRGISAWTTHLFFNGDFTYSESGEDTKRHLDTFRDGLWRLIRRAERQHDQVAIYYSMPTIIAGSLVNEEQRINSARDAWVKLIEDAGLQYEFVSPELVANGLLEQGYKLLVMPYTLALSEAEADAIRRFVAGGGTIVATRPVAVRDELSRPKSPGLLDDLFGVRVGGEATAVEPKLTLTQEVGGLAAGTEIRMPVALSNLELTGGQPLATAADGQVPAVIGGADGHAWLLNLDLANFETERKFRSPTEQQVKAIVADLFARAGVRPPYPATLGSGNAPQLEMMRYRLGEVEYLGLLNWEDKPDIATIDLGGEKQVYDVRGGSDRGRMTALQVPLEPLGARVFALTTGPLPAPTLTLVEPTVAAAREGAPGEILVRVGRAAAGPAPQLVRVEVIDADGRTREELQQTVWVDNEPVSTSLPLWLNAPRGAWRLRATDVTSGQMVEAAVTVG